MKDAIIAAFKTKYLRFGLSNEAIDRIASAKEKTVTSEDQIETAIADAETMGLIATELQKMRDKEIQTRTDLQATFDTYKEKHPETTPSVDPQKPKNDEEPEWAKKLRESNERIEARFKADDDAKKLSENLSAVEAKLKAEGCTNPGILKGVLKGFALGKDEDVDAATARLKEEYNNSYKETFGEGVPPGFGSNDFGDGKEAIKHKNDFLRTQGLLPKEEK